MDHHQLTAEVVQKYLKWGDGVNRNAGPLRKLFKRISVLLTLVHPSAPMSILCPALPPCSRRLTPPRTTWPDFSYWLTFWEAEPMGRGRSEGSRVRRAGALVPTSLPVFCLSADTPTPPTSGLHSCRLQYHDSPPLLKSRGADNFLLCQCWGEIPFWLPWPASPSANSSFINVSSLEVTEWDSVSCLDLPYKPSALNFPSPASEVNDHTQTCLG